MRPDGSRLPRIESVRRHAHGCPASQNQLRRREPASHQEPRGDQVMFETAVFLGPARVLAEDGKTGRVQVALPDGDEVWARLALAVPYHPAVGDEVLVICQEMPDAYVIGVLRGHGTTTLR